MIAPIATIAIPIGLVKKAIAVPKAVEMPVDIPATMFQIFKAALTTPKAVANEPIINAKLDTASEFSEIQSPIVDKISPRSFKTSTITPPLHSASGFKTLFHKKSNAGLNASITPLSKSIAPLSASKNAGIKSSILYFASGNKTFL